MFQNSLFDEPTTLSVSQVNANIRDLLEGSALMRGLTIRGEVTGFTRPNSGHWYFSIKDKDSQLRCVMWRTTAERQTFIPNNGDDIEINGRIVVYTPRGEYQLQAERVRPVGLGDLFAQFERLKAKLAQDGLFDADRKRPLPVFPLRIGVVTSPTAAAFQDIQHVLSRRFPLAHVILSPTLVQGVDAPPQIVRAIERLNTYGQVDVILLIRGGGSMEDLWCFNDERVARAVSASAIPIVSGVGHEIDFTMVDFVSDLRAPTPSAAAEQTTPHIDGLRELVQERLKQMRLSYTDRLTSLGEDVQDLERTLEYSSPLQHINTMRQRIDHLVNLLDIRHKMQLAVGHERLKSKLSALESANPTAILNRGYAIVRRADTGKSVKSVQDVSDAPALKIQVSDGEFDAQV